VRIEQEDGKTGRFLGSGRAPARVRAQRARRHLQTPNLLPGFPASCFLFLTLVLGGPAAAQPSPASQPASASQAGLDRRGARQDNTQALRLLRRGKAEEAAALLARAAQRDPQDAEIANNLGHALHLSGRFADAERAYKQALDVDPHRWLALLGLAELWAADPTRWDRRGEIVAFLTRGLERITDEKGRVNVTLRLAAFEKSVGRTAAARARLGALRDGTLGPQERKRVLDELDAVSTEERARAFADWPEPAPAAEEQAALGRAERALREGDSAAALRLTEPLVQRRPAWRALRWLRARAFEALGRFDDAARELTVLVRLAPSHADAWRRLGRILVTRGGALDAERADEALRHALALEPAWSDLWLLRAQAALRRGRADVALAAVGRLLREAPERERDPEVARLLAAARAEVRSTGAAPSAASREPSPRARSLYREAQEGMVLGDAPEMTRELLGKILEDSPGFLDAAIAWYALAGTVPERTVQALWGSGEALLELAARVRSLAREPPERTRAVVRPWIDRAVALGAPEARFERAVLRADDGDARGALLDLVEYVARTPEPGHLDEARALRATLAPGRDEGAQLLWRIRLIEDRPGDALAALGGRCEDAPARAEAIGAVHEFMGDLEQAARCYEAARRAQPSARRPLERLAGIAGRAPLPLVAALAPALEEAARRGIVAAEWPLARHLVARGRDAEALAHLDRYLAAAPDGGPGIAEAQALRERLRRSRADRDRALRRRIVLGASAPAALVLVLVLVLFRGRRVVRALRARPDLFPELARAVGEIRHDVIKHRASVLSLLERDEAPREEVARALTQPEAASSVVAATYARLRRAARARGVSLRPLGREPIFGPLARDLRRAEALVTGGGARAAITAVDTRLREVHSERLAALLKHGPRTRVDAAVIVDWIGAVEAEMRERGGGWTPPALVLGAIALEFPVARPALATIFANLLRNAQAAVKDAPGAKVLVRLDDERDATGRRLVTLLIGDSAEEPLDLAQIETRESGRGLSIVRDLTREWRGHLVVRPEPLPLRKAVGACFPA
jgi:tetratricopeptide (TPR) repeat protein